MENLNLREAFNYVETKEYYENLWKEEYEKLLKSYSKKTK
tara:strand:- start:392 stop:511 length:120 start_codon:yes stop_codon:yes gene_type:complete